MPQTHNCSICFHCSWVSMPINNKFTAIWPVQYDTKERLLCYLCQIMCFQQNLKTRQNNAFYGEQWKFPSRQSATTTPALWATGLFFSSYWYIEFPPISILNMEPSVIMYIITAYTHSSMNGRWTPLQHRISLPLRLRHWVKMINGMIALFCAPGTFSPHTNFIAKIFVVGRTCIFVAEPNKQNLLRYFSKFSRHAIIWRGLKN